MKSSSLGVMAEAVGNMALDLEAAAKEGDMAFIKEKNPPFLEAAEKLIADIRAYLGIMDESRTKIAADRPDPELVESLVEACRNYDMDGVDAALKELGKRSYVSDPGLVDWLKEKADMMEFEDIIAKFNMGAEAPAGRAD